MGNIQYNLSNLILFSVSFISCSGCWCQKVFCIYITEYIAQKISVLGEDQERRKNNF